MMPPIPTEYVELAKECEAMGRPDLAFSARHLGHEHMRKVFTLNEIVEDAREDEQLAYVARIPQRKRFVPTIIEGGAA